MVSHDADIFQIKHQNPHFYISEHYKNMKEHQHEVSFTTGSWTKVSSTKSEVVYEVTSKLVSLVSILECFNFNLRYDKYDDIQPEKRARNFPGMGLNPVSCGVNDYGKFYLDVYSDWDKFDHSHRRILV